MLNASILRSLVALVATFALATAAAPAGARTQANFRFQADTAFDFSQGECCAQWYFGTPTAVTVPHLGPATLTTFFFQCFSPTVCTPQYSELTLTFETANGDRLVLLGSAPNLGTSTVTDTGLEIDIAGTWTVQPASTGKFATYRGSGSFSFDLVQPVGSVGGPEHLALTGTLKAK